MIILGDAKIARFTRRHRVAAPWLDRWFGQVLRASWSTPDEARQTMLGARPISRRRVVFNVKGNDYRIVAVVDYVNQQLEIRFVGTHEQYDKIDPLEV